MKKISLMIFFCVNVFATNLLTYNVYQREDRLDIVLGFDSPFTGQIVQKPYNIPFYTLVLKGLNYDGMVDKNLNATLAESMQITSKANQTFITFKSSKPLNMNAVFLNKEKFGIRIRLTPKIDKTQALADNKSNALLTTNQLMSNQSVSFDENDMTFRYILVIVFLMVIVFILFVLKKKINSSGKNIFKINNKNLNIKYEKYLDKNNRFMVLEYESQSYVVIVGNTNLLLDKKGITNPNESFEAYFEENKARINQMLESRKRDMLNKKSSTNSYKSRLDSEVLK